MSKRIKKKEHDSSAPQVHPYYADKNEGMWKTATIALAVLLVLSLFTKGYTDFGSFKLNFGNNANNNNNNNNGGSKAQIVIDEYSDFECPFCGRAYPTVKQIQETYGDKVEVVFHHFPLSFHPNAQKASEASECARDQGKFWEMHDKLFDNQQALGVDNLKKYAVDLGLDSAKFNKCLDSAEKASVVQADFNAGQQKGVRGTPTFFINGEQLVGAQPFENFKAIIDRQLAGGAPVVAAPEPEPTVPPTPTEVSADMDDDPVEGDAKAKVVIVEWSDFECPFCGRFYTQTLTEIRKNYVDTGKVRVVFRDFPLSFHPDAMPAALAAECADDQGKFWEMHDKIFENQAELSVDNLKLWAKDMGLDMTKWTDCYDSKKYESEINSDMAEGGQSGVQGTPGFVIGIVQEDGKTVIGESVRGAQPYANFAAAIDRQLAKV